MSGSCENSNHENILNFADYNIYEKLYHLNNPKIIEDVTSRRCLLIPNIGKTKNKKADLTYCKINSEFPHIKEYNTFDLIYRDRAPTSPKIQVQTDTQKVKTNTYETSNIASSHTIIKETKSAVNDEIHVNEVYDFIKTSKDYVFGPSQLLNLCRGFPHQNLEKINQNSDKRNYFDIINKIKKSGSSRTEPSDAAKILCLNLRMDLPKPNINWKLY